MHDIGFVYDRATGTTQVVLWDDDSQTLLLKDSDSGKGSGFPFAPSRHPAPEDVYTEQVKNVPVRKEKHENLC